MALTPNAPAKRVHGKGKAVLHAFGKEASFSELSYTYPLKLLSPKLPSDGNPVSIVYILSYGGGLVPGDKIDLEVDVGAGASLMLLTQAMLDAGSSGSTKVFKTRPNHDYRLASKLVPISDTTAPSSDTVQCMDAKVANGAFLLLLVDPVTCFRAASYTQHQTFHLEPDASLIVLDWLTAGRVSRDEEWVLAKYHSINEVWQSGRRIARDVMLLEQTLDSAPLPSRTLKDRLAPYSCYATLLMFGPMVTNIASNLAAQYDAISQMQRTSVPDFMWSFSLLDGGCIVRVAGLETEVVKMWLNDALADVAQVIGNNTFQKAFV